MSLVKVAKIDMIPAGELKQFKIDGHEVLVINLDGQFYCLPAMCTHAGAPLVEGEIHGDIIICPWHGSNFRISDGSVIKGPAEKPLTVYPCIVQDNYLLVDI
jgi:nitrite reductase/ring-hydroxylating ferredoxin subunit